MELNTSIDDIQKEIAEFRTQADEKLPPSHSQEVAEPMFELDLSSSSELSKVEAPTVPDTNADYKIGAFSHLSFFSPEPEDEKGNAETEQEIDEKLTAIPSAEMERRSIDPENSHAFQIKTRIDDEKVQSIIEQFLENEPAVSKPVGNARQENLAAGSSIEDEDLVTETLAIIHARQGNFTKATKIYERLALLFPEKKSYFAEQILKLKK